MKKLISFLLIFNACLCSVLCGCNGDAATKVIYKKVGYVNADALEKEVVFVIPEDWAFAEKYQGDKLIEFQNQNGKEIGNVKLNEFYSGEKAVYDLKEKMEPFYEKPKFDKISKDCFIISVEKLGNIIVYKVEDEVIDIFLDKTVSADVVKQIAEKTEIKDFEKPEDEEETSSQTSDTSSDEMINPNPDISFLDNPSVLHDGLSQGQFYDLFNAVNSVKSLMGHPVVGNVIRFENNYTSSRLALMGADGHVYELVDDFRKGTFSLIKRSVAGWNADTNNNELLATKMLPNHCSLMTEYDEYMHRFTDKKSFITTAQADRIVENPFLFQHLSKEALVPEDFKVSQDGMIVSAKLYIPQLGAFLYITENYRDMTVGFDVAAVNGETKHIPTKWLEKYHVKKKLNEKTSVTAKDRFKYAEYGVIFS